MDRLGLSRFQRYEWNYKFWIARERIWKFRVGH